MALPTVTAIAKGEDMSGTGPAYIEAAAINTPAGKLLAVCCHSYGAPTSFTVTDTAGNTYVASPDAIIDQGLHSYNRWFYAKNTAAHATNVVRCTFGTAASYCAIGALLIDSADTAAPLGSNATGTQASGTDITSGTFSTGANELILASIVTGNLGFTFTAGTNFTKQNFDAAGNGADESWGAASAQTTIAAHMTVSSSVDATIAVITIKGASGGGGGDPHTAKVGGDVDGLLNGSVT